MQKNKVALIGNPNVGKSTIFNILCKMNQHTGNWPGKTVSQAVGTYTYLDNEFEVIDLPGTYSLYANSYEEVIARDYVCFAEYDLLVIVCDASLLERNLYLLFQTLEVTNKAILCINLIDEAQRKGIKLYINKLKELIKIPIILTSATSNRGLDELKQAIYKRIQIEEANTFKIDYGIYEKDILDIENKIALKMEKEQIRLNRRFCAIKLLEHGELGQKIEKMYDFNINAKNDLSMRLTKKLIQFSEITANEVIRKDKKKADYNKIDKLLTHRLWGNVCLIALLGLIFYITIVLANYPTQLLSQAFAYLEPYLHNFLVLLKAPSWAFELIINNIYRIASLVIAVMLPPMAIFFPMFTLLEDVGYLPRIAFNLDYYFQKVKAHGKQALCMCMGFGCNVVGVIGGRIIDSPKERLLSILTNSFIPCNGRFPSLISIIAIFMFVGSNSLLQALILLIVILIAVLVSLMATYFLSTYVVKGERSSFILELPSYRKPRFMKVIMRSIFDKTLKVLGRAIMVVIPVGFLLFTMNLIMINDISLITYLSNFLDPLGQLMGLDGIILSAFILGFPANEIVIPIMVMLYQSGSTITQLDLPSLGALLISNGWNIKSAICMLVFIIMHWPCANTMIAIYQETLSKKYTLIGFMLPTICGIVCCISINLIFTLFGF